ncbi:MAG: MFS transporter, partial [Alphaproteobacteria bacterium]|nr:MFS transporter [Alphaproteobacteria bacterium]
TLPDIAAELSASNPNRAQLVVTSFVFGMGIGTLLTGPLSDTFGRRPVLLAGAGLYITGALLSMLSQSLELLLAARVIMGLGAAGPRVVAMAIIRDLFAGRDMARIMSFVMLVFTLVPALAPLVGTGIIAISSWRGVFAGFVLFALIGATWFYLRQPETLEPDLRRPFNAGTLRRGVFEVMRHRVSALSTLTQATVMGLLFAAISNVQPIFDITYGAAGSFPYWFCLIALISGSSSLLNARIVARLGMRTVTGRALVAQLAASTLATVAFGSHLLPQGAEFWFFLLWMQGVFFMLGLTIGNLNALAMEPMGHLAGLAASVVGAVSTVLAVFIAIPISLLFDGTPFWLMLGAVLCSALGRILIALIPAEAEVRPSEPLSTAPSDLAR